MDLFLTGGMLADGTGTEPRPADVVVSGGLVHSILPPGGPPPAGTARRDVSGLVVCPGFVDLHTHSDLTVLSGPQARSKVHQGVTTEVVGNCGLGVAPLTPQADLALVRQSVSYLDLDPAVDWAWQDVAGYRAAVTAARPSVNIATLTAHIPLRAGTVGFSDRPATGPELAEMRSLLAESFAQGSAGLSTGLVYAPLCYVPDQELEELGHEVAAHDRVFAWHVRDYGDDLLDSVRQALRVAERTGCRTQISHLAAVGRRNWGTVRRALDLIDAAAGRGAVIGVDVYPYLFGNAPLAQLLPAWAHDGGAGAMAGRLRDPGERDRIRAGWTTRALGWDEITVSWVPPDSAAAGCVGQTIAGIAAARGTDGDSVALDLLADLGMGVLIVAGGRSEVDLRDVLSHPAAVIASDGLCLDPGGITGAGTPHPRSYGCFPRYLSQYAGGTPGGLGAAIARITGVPARIAGLRDRGVLRPGAPADIVAFRPGDIADTATFADPQRYPAGIELVLVNGEPVIEAGQHTGQRPGRALAPVTEMEDQR